MFGRVIHEFDPWFNFRATQYMVDHGILEFFDWFDDKAWYPIGRHVGSTTYPGILITSTLIYKFLNFIGWSISINDVCVFIPAGFGALTCLFTYGITKEVAGSWKPAVIAAIVMAIIPAHLMRSIAGGYDNEAVALTAIVSTFYLWIRSLRTNKSWVLAPLTALSYIYMVSAWGGYTFVINMVGLHAGVCLAMTFLSDEDTDTLASHSNTYKSYTIFYIIGTLGAIQFPMVRLQPLQSMEQIMPLLVFVGYQVFQLMYFWRNYQKMSHSQFQRFKKQFLVVSVFLVLFVFVPLFLSGWFGPFSNRVRSLFIPHTRTGNPLVDSVSEHQATAPYYYWQYFHLVYLVAPFGLLFLFQNPNKAKIFAILYSALSYYFSQKMVRLLLILSAPASMLAGIVIQQFFAWCHENMLQNNANQTPTEEKKPKKSSSTLPTLPPGLKPYLPTISAVMLCVFLFLGVRFFLHCHLVSQMISNPQVMLLAKDAEGKLVIVDDFMRAYWWLRDNTPEDSRVMAWWDYGYQINGIANRTTIADGNTWNHEHIALLGKALVSPEEKSWQIARYLADYVLVWTTRYAGYRGDDLAKMPHIANIAGSVYPEIERTGYYLDKDDQPSPLMKESLLYKLSVYGIKDNKPLKYYQEVYTSPRKMVRIYKVLDVAERHPFGTYHPQLELGQFKE
uniref:dolichyl-diphosphooligosaccharide--protein glycotransferase n=1 Tax=Arcella intermedia TaxID=1963864 RepID=A0A6B2KYV0_9EUKA